MKKLLLLLFVAISLTGFSQYQEINNGESGLSVRTKMNDMHEQIFEYGTSIQFSADGSANWHSDFLSTDNYQRFSDDFGVSWSSANALSVASTFTDIALENGSNRMIYIKTKAALDGDGDDLTLMAGGASNGNGGEATLKGGFGTTQGNVNIGTTYDEVAINMDDTINMRGHKIDSLPLIPTNPTEATSKSYVDSKSGGVDSIAYAEDDTLRVYLNGSVTAKTEIMASKNIYSITLPSGSSVAARIATPTSLPDGWSLTADGVNLIVTHNLGRWSGGAKIQANTSGTIWQELRNTASDNGFSNLNSNQFEIYSLATVLKPIKIYVTFE